MSQDIKVSVICNAFNHGKYIRDALEGFVSQKTDFPFEVLIHDDASTDDTADIIREYEERYPEIIKPIYQSENQYSQKISISITYQVPRAKGKYIALCEGDDYWTDPLKLQKQYDFLEAHPDYSLCACSTFWMNTLNGNRVDQGVVSEDIDITFEDLLENRDRIFHYATILMRADLWKDRPAWIREFPVGDIPLTIHAALNGKIRMLADEMAVYRWYSSGSWTVRMDNDARRANVCRRMIQGFTALNEQTGYQYDAVIRRRLNQQKYTLALMEHDLKAIRSKELRDIYRSRNLVHRLSDITRCAFPKLYSLLRKGVRKVDK